MTDPATNSKDTLKQLSRRTLLRNSAITAAGAVLLPTFLTGCNKDVWDIVKGHIPNGGSGGVQLTASDLAQAASNLTTLRTLLKEVYELAAQYDDAVFHDLNSTATSSWTNFIVDIIIDIAAGLLSAAAIAAEGPAAIPAIAFVSAILHDWGIGKDKPSNLEAVFAQFEFGRVAMQNAIEDKLSSLADPNYPTNDYKNLQAAWKDPIVFNGNTYTLADLASTKFTLGDEYNKLHDAAFTSMKKSVWNLLIMRCCSYYENYHDTAVTPKHGGALVEYAQQTFYPQNKGVYLRAKYIDTNPDTNTFELIYYNLGIGGYPFPDAASNKLFMDDTPGHIINPDGLFNRSYVFEQFSTTKPDFLTKWHELASDPYSDFSFNDDWNFTGEMFPDLTH